MTRKLGSLGGNNTPTSPSTGVDGVVYALKHQFTAATAPGTNPSSYNLGSWGVIKTELGHLDARHRRHCLDIKLYYFCRATQPVNA